MRPHHHRQTVLLLSWTVALTVVFLPVANGEAAEAFQWKTDEGKSLTLSHGDQVLWQFRYDTEQAKPYFHPVALPDGRVLTWDNPPDHRWHHALWFSWKSINGVNYWEPDASGKPAGKTKWQNVEIQTREDGTARLAMDLLYGPDEEKVVMKERRVIEVSPPANDGTYRFDWICQFTTGPEKVVLDRTPLPGEPGGLAWGGYAGLSVRFAKDFADRQATTPEGPVEFNAESCFRGKSTALDYNGLIGGRPCGIAIIDHPQNLNYPTPWYVIRAQPMSYFSPAVICYRPHTVEAGESFTLRYRVAVHDGRWNPLDLAVETREFLGETAQVTPLLDEHDYEGRRQQLEALMADLTRRILPAEDALRQFDGEFRKAAEAHPGRAAYLEAMAATESLRAALAAAEKRVADKKLELARAEQETLLALKDLEAQRLRAQEELLVSYDNQVWEAENEGASPAEIREIRREYTRMQNSTNVRYDTLQISLKQKRSSTEQKVREAVAPLGAEVNRIKTEQLGPAMARAAPFQAFLDQGQQKRQVIAGRLDSLHQDLAGAEKRLKNLPKPRPAEDIAQGRLKMAKALLNQNPKAGRKRLEEIVAKYAGTKAAQEAAEILAELGEN